MIPTYRAKKIDSSEWVEGYLTKCQSSHFIESGSSHCDEIDTSTLSINFPDMIDSQGKKIFASLSESGKGGDILDISGKTETLFIEDSIIQTYMFKWEDLKDFKRVQIGIQE